MKQSTTLFSVLGVTALLVGSVALPTSAWAQGGGGRRQGRNADRDQAPLAGRMAKGTLQNMTFGDSATLTFKTEDGETLSLAWANAKFHWNNADSSPSTFALKNLPGSAIVILYAQSQGRSSLREAWDLVSWNAELNNHKGIQTGGISQLTNRVLTITNHRYALTKDTVFVKAGKTATREDFKSRDTVWVKGDTSTGVPVALVVADTEAGASSNALDRSQAERTEGITPRPAPGTGTGTQGNTRSPSVGSSNPTGGTAYTVRMFLKILDSADNESGTDPVGTVGNAASKLGIQDNKVECYGELRANGMRVWEIKKEEARQTQRKAGETITLLPSESSGMRNGSTWRVSGSTLALTGTLYDDDLASSADVLYSWSLNLNLAQLANTGEKVFKSSGSKAELHVVVTR